jgi:SAM-dependent methyltransferase
MSEPQIQPAGNFYDKYHTRNPVARALMAGFLRAFDELSAFAGGSGRALEIGCGEGELSMRLAAAGWQVEGCDIARVAVDESIARATAAGMDIRFSQCAIEQADAHFEVARLVVCCEVLEHLEDPLGGLDVLDRLSTDYVLVSVPREPLWRALNLARLRYIQALGNTPGHVQHWSRGMFVKMLEKRFEIVAVRSPLPWTMVLCRVRR